MITSITTFEATNPHFLRIVVMDEGEHGDIIVAQTQAACVNNVMSFFQADHIAWILSITVSFCSKLWGRMQKDACGRREG